MIRCLGYKLGKLGWENMDKTRLAMGSKLGNLSDRGLLNYYYHYLTLGLVAYPRLASK